MFSYSISQGWRIQRVGSLTIPLCRPLYCPESWVLYYALFFSAHRTGFLWDLGLGTEMAIKVHWTEMAILCLVNHFCVDLVICLGSLSCSETQWSEVKTLWSTFKCEILITKRLQLHLFYRTCWQSFWHWWFCYENFFLNVAFFIKWI